MALRRASAKIPVRLPYVWQPARRQAALRPHLASVRPVEDRCPLRALPAADPGVACAVRPSLSACDASTMRTSPAQNSANAT